MTASQGDYFRYFARNAESETWGLAVTAAGFTHIKSGADYPPVRHPADHHFDWRHGRTLRALQIVLITSGRGIFETRKKRWVIKAGQAFLLPPGLWHRYRPDPTTGWDENWIEVTGPTVMQLVRAKVFSRHEPVRAGGLNGGLETAMNAVHALARIAGPGFSALLSAEAYRVLATWDHLRQPLPVRSRLQVAVMAAEQYLGQHLVEPVNIAQLARKLGVAYSHFRRAFKAHTGYAPWQYTLHLRLIHVRRALSASDMTLEEVATSYGFSSAFHLSAAFKRVYKIAPNHWRRQLGSENAP